MSPRKCLANEIIDFVPRGVGPDVVRLDILNGLINDVPCPSLPFVSLHGGLDVPLHKFFNFSSILLIFDEVRIEWIAGPQCCVTSECHVVLLGKADHLITIFVVEISPRFGNLLHFADGLGC